MIDKQDIEFCKKQAKKYIEDMKDIGDNAGWVKILLYYIEQLETRKKELRKSRSYINAK